MESGVCSVRADPRIFSKNDPCPHTPKYLEVQYNCVRKYKSEVAINKAGKRKGYQISDLCSHYHISFSGFLSFQIISDL